MHFFIRTDNCRKTRLLSLFARSNSLNKVETTIMLHVTASILFILLSAFLGAINIPISKMLFPYVPTLLLSSLTFLGGSLGAGIVTIVRMLKQKKSFKFIKGRDWLYVLGINVADVGANVMFFYGLSMLSGDTAALLQAFETVATAVVAFFLLKERASPRLLVAIAIIVGASVLLSLNPSQGYHFEPASLLIIGATICWGFDNVLSKKVAERDPFEYSFFKCLMPGLVILILALATGNFHAEWSYIGLSLLDGVVTYGLSIVFFILGFRKLSAGMGGALYATNPFFGAILSLVFFPHQPSWTFYVAIVLLLGGEVIVGVDAHLTEKRNKELAAKENDHPALP